MDTVIVSPAFVEVSFNPLYVEGLEPPEKSEDAEATTAGAEGAAAEMALLIIVARPFPFTVS